MSAALKKVALTLALVLAATAGFIGYASTQTAFKAKAGVTAPAASRAGQAVTQQAASKRRPNVVVIMADDMRTDDLRFMPSVRKLMIRKGLRFTNSFSPYPLCCPARSSFMSGRYAHNHRVYSHRPPYGFGSFDDRRTIATVMRRNGYKTGFIGKYLNGYGVQKVRGTKRPSVRYVPPGWTDWHASIDHTAHPWPHRLSGSTYHYFDTTFNVNGRLQPNQGRYSTNVVGEKARNLIGKYSRTRAPFFLWVSAVAPHHGGPTEKDDPRIATPARPNWVKGKFDKRIRRPVGLTRSGVSERDVSDKPGHIRRRSQLTPKVIRDLRDANRQRAESIFVLDRQVRRIIAKLKRTGEYRNTVIAFTSDNGFFAGEHRVRKGKVLPYEPSLRVPMVIAGGRVPHGVRHDPISTVDLTATIRDYANTRAPHPADGVSLLPTIRGGDRGWTRPVLTEAVLNPPTLANPQRGVGMSPVNRSGRDPEFNTPLAAIGIRTADYKFVRYSNGESELYHLLEDPNELDNLVDKPRYASVVAEMRRLWKSYRNCRGAECSERLPQQWQVGARQLASHTLAQERLVRQRLGH